MVFDLDDFGMDFVISDMTQSKDCRDALEVLKQSNPKLKVTLFTIPFYVTDEIKDWLLINSNWVQLAWHGFYHESNYECEKMTYAEFDKLMTDFKHLGPFFVRGFKAPGWQISDDIYRWLLDNDFWVADQSYNNHRRPGGLPAYVNHDGVFKVGDKEIEAWHGHTWNCVGNGIYETLDELLIKFKDVKEFKLITEVL